MPSPAWLWGRVDMRLALADEKTASVTIDNFSFNPAVLEITVGTTVTWTNRDEQGAADEPPEIVQRSGQLLVDLEPVCGSHRLLRRRPWPIGRTR